MKKLFIPRVPEATRSNKEEFVAKYVFANGGTVSNAERVWFIEATRNEKRDLSRPFVPLTKHTDQ